MAKAEQIDREETPIGLQNAICAFSVDLGIQESTYEGEKTKKHEVLLCWELEEKMTKGKFQGKPFMVSKRYNVSLGKKANLSLALEGWFAREFTPEQREIGFDTDQLVGTQCTLTLTKTPKGSVKVTAIAPMQKNATKLEIVNEEPPKWAIELAEKGGATEYCGGASAKSDQIPF